MCLLKLTRRSGASVLIHTRYITSVGVQEEGGYGHGETFVHMYGSSTTNWIVKETPEEIEKLLADEEDYFVTEIPL